VVQAVLVMQMIAMHGTWGLLQTLLCGLMVGRPLPSD